MTRINNAGLSKILIISLFGFLVLVGGLVAWNVINKPDPPPSPVTLNIWGVWDETSDWQQIISSYNALHPYITINYSKIRYEEYEKMLLEGWATSSGPDIFAIPNSWVQSYSSKFIYPLPATTAVSYYTTKKVLFKTETTIEKRNEPSLNAGSINRDYIDTVYNDIIIGGQIYGLPMGINTLALYFNRDLLSQANIVQPPQTWSDFTNMVQSIAIVNNDDEIVRAATALGGYDNMANVSDIVTLLLMQNGANMTVVKKQALFNQASSSDPTYFPAQEALRFYTDFSNPTKSVYTWNNQMPDALNEFASGKLAFLFAYPFQESEIRAKAQGINYEVSTIPQINPNNKVNYANYWIYTVAKNSPYVGFAWNFLQYAANTANVTSYIENTQQTSALRSVITEQLKDPDRGVLAQQALTAKSWYRGQNPQNTEIYFSEMIENIVNETLTIEKALEVAANKIGSEY
ncbi:MAG: extracellular solute-binding protein [bacterium]|nr:extracellular solute-binding protein [bacterium]